MKSVKVKDIFLAAVIFLSAGCQAENIDLNDMVSSEKKFNERQSKEIVAQMSLKTMFPDQGARTLAEAAGKGQVAKVEELVEKGVDVNFRGTKDATPLFWAMRNLNGFEKLLELGADPNVVFAGGSVIHWSAMNKDLRFLKAALERGGNPNLVAGQFGETPLFKTIGIKGEDNREAMLLLLSAGANINAQTSGEVFGMSMGGKTPLMAAADVVRFDIVGELLELGADYSLKDDSGRDLVDRITSVKGRFASGSEQEKSLKNVILWLESRGVDVPN
ncbi:ankyrin repeat domain-containing protein [Microbulbifer sp. TYP-18]|uniref:ankyrin repeat domain-containing protein n=1 Tax=Microbulbifer sp. TYP-18 TaxID=3230024 RepID=UPI0034C63E90